MLAAMDIEDAEDVLEDMLFGFSSQETTDQADCYSDSEDDMLVDASDSEVDIWDSQEDLALPTPPTEVDQADDMLDFGDEGTPDLIDFETNQHSGSPARDR
jgi:hypothetical protein